MMHMTALAVSLASLQKRRRTGWYKERHES